MAGYREFQTGEVLTAANVNQFLMEQSVMRFADDAARTTALASVLAEGMLTYNEDTAALERYDGTAWVPAAPVIPGIGSNVVQTVKTDVFSSSSSTNVTVTGLEATITPSTNTSKVLIVAQITTNLAEYGIFTLGGGNAADYRGAAAGSRDRAVFAPGASIANEGNGQLVALTVVYLDSPGTTSPVTYSVQGRVRAGTGSFRVNARVTDGDAADVVRGASSITVIEVAA